MNNNSINLSEYFAAASYGNLKAPVKAILFDIDGTLIGEHEVKVREILQRCKDLNLTIMIGTANIEMAAEKLNAAGIDVGGISVLDKRMARKELARLNKPWAHIDDSDFDLDFSSVSGAAVCCNVQSLGCK